MSSVGLHGVTRTHSTAASSRSGLAHFPRKRARSPGRAKEQSETVDTAYL